MSQTTYGPRHGGNGVLSWFQVRAGPLALSSLGGKYPVAKRPLGQFSVLMLCRLFVRRVSNISSLSKMGDLLTASLIGSPIFTSSSGAAFIYLQVESAMSFAVTTTTSSSLVFSVLAVQGVATSWVQVPPELRVGSATASVPFLQEVSSTSNIIKVLTTSAVESTLVLSTLSLLVASSETTKVEVSRS